MKSETKFVKGDIIRPRYSENKYLVCRVTKCAFKDCSEYPLCGKQLDVMSISPERDFLSMKELRCAHGFKR